jgi:hypothetical protein
MTENAFGGILDLLNHRFLDIVYVTFQGAQNAENEFPKIAYTLKHSFLERT